MSRQIQIRRGTATQHSNFTGAIGEVTMDTTNNTLRVHDGVTPGGNEIMSVNKFYSNIKNVITKISKDIELELNNGTLTLKSGSKVYIPNGTGVFDEIVIDSDKTFTLGSAQSNQFFVVYNKTQSCLDLSYVPNTASGTTPPSDGLFYNISNNTIRFYVSGSVGNDEFSLPLGIITAQSVTPYIKSLDKVFNGLGYIGSTVFVLPGVSGLIPNGCNTDGLKNNTEYSLPHVSILDMSSVISDNRNIILKNDGTLESATFIRLTSDNYLLNEENVIKQAFSVANCYTDSYGKIKAFNKKESFELLDKESIASVSMPGNVFCDLSIGASGTIYTAPAAGYFIIRLQIGNSGYLQINTNGSDMGWGANTQVSYMLPVSKGQKWQLYYNKRESVNYEHITFVYANYGE